MVSLTLGFTDIRAMHPKKCSRNIRFLHIIAAKTQEKHTTGLTQEIDIMDIGSSTPKRKCQIAEKLKSPLKGVLKIR